MIGAPFDLALLSLVEGLTTNGTSTVMNKVTLSKRYYRGD